MKAAEFSQLKQSVNSLERIENDNRRTIDAKLEELFQQVIS
jgi:uncharacterized protein (UPF0335 family)